MAKPTFNDKNLRWYRDIGFSLEEMDRVFRDMPADKIAERLARLNRQDGIRPAYDAQEQQQAQRVARSRPFPPDDMTDEDRERERFVAAPDVQSWLLATFLAQEGPLFNPDHEHLVDAQIGVLWTNVANSKGGKTIAATAEIPHFSGPPWSARRAELHLAQLLGGGDIPDFLLIFDSVYAQEADDATWCARCEHELYHCGQALDRWGSPRFNPFTGLPVFALKPHDCEEFVGVVKRYGVGAAAAGTERLVEAAKRPPLFSAERCELACGTCRR